MKDIIVTDEDGKDIVIDIEDVESMEIIVNDNHEYFNAVKIKLKVFPFFIRVFPGDPEKYIEEHFTSQKK